MFHKTKFGENERLLMISIETWIIFVMWLLINSVVNVAETFKDIVKYYLLQMHVKCVKCIL